MSNARFYKWRAKFGGMSALGKWIRTYRDADVVSKQDWELAKANEESGMIINPYIP